MEMAAASTAMRSLSPSGRATACTRQAWHETKGSLCHHQDPVCVSRQNAREVMLGTVQFDCVPGKPPPRRRHQAGP